MLNDKDLEKIRIVIREEIEAESSNTKNELQTDIKMSQMRITGIIDELKNRVKNIEIKINQISKDLKYAINFLDKEDVKTVKRIDRIENHLNLPPIS
jgi:hypothetical protein